MRIDAFANESPYLYDTKTPVLLEGPPGCAKSYTIEHTIPRKIANHIGVDRVPVVSFNLNTVDGPDMRGFLFPSKDANGEATARFTRSPIAQAIMDTGSDVGVLFFDERSQADHIIQKGAAEVIEARRIGNFAIPDGWWIISAGNRMEDRSGVVRPLMHLRNREAVVQIDPHAPGFIRWAETTANMHPMLVAFARFKPGAIQVSEVPADPKPFATYRSFTKAANYLAAKAGTDADGNPSMNLPWDEGTQSIVSGLVGDGLAAEIAAFAKVHTQLPSFKQIVADPEKAKLPDDNRLDAQFAAVSMAVHHADPTNAEPVFRYILRLRKELQASAAASLLGKGGGALLNSPSIAKWITENKALIQSTFK